MDIRQESLKKHYEWNGKIEVVSRVPINTSEDLSLAYTPGVAEPCLEINKDYEKSFSLTRRNNLVAVVTDGTAVLGLGDIGPEAGMPVMEGKCALFKEFGDVDAFPICVRSKDVDEIVKTIYLISGSFGGINLEDISAPRCVAIERRLNKELNIPVFHDDQHGTAIVVLAALINALKVVNKKCEDCKVVISGTGAAGSSIIRHLYNYGFTNIIASDKDGILRQCEKDGYDFLKQELLEYVNKEDIDYKNLAEAMVNADIFIGVSAPNLVSKEMVKSMNKDAIIFSMANPNPEITYDDAKQAGARIVGTGRSDKPNQINNLLAFPGLFRGLLDGGAIKMDEDIKIIVSKAIASLISEDELNDEYIIPSVFDERLVPTIAREVSDYVKKTGNSRLCQS